MTSLGALGAIFFRGVWCARSSPPTRGTASRPTRRTRLQPGLRVGRGRGRALVDPHARPAAGGGSPWAAGRGDRVAGGFVHGGQRRVQRSSTRRSVRSACWSPWFRMSPWSTRRLPTRRATSCFPNPCSTGCGGPGPPGGASWRRSSVSSTTSRGSATGCACPHTGSWRWWRRPTAPTPVAVTRPGLPVRATARTSRTGAPSPTPPARDELDDYAEKWVLGPATHEDYLARVGSEQLLWLEGRSDPMSWKARRRRQPGRRGPRRHPWEQAASLGAREVERMVAEVDADAVLAGAGVANLAAWVAVARAGRPGAR